MKIEDVEASVATEICDELSEDIFTKPLVLAKGDWFECDVCNAWYYLSRTMIHIDNTACLSVVVHNVSAYLSLCLSLKQLNVLWSLCHILVVLPSCLFSQNYTVFQQRHCQCVWHFTASCSAFQRVWQTRRWYSSACCWQGDGHSFAFFCSLVNCVYSSRQT